MKFVEREELGCRGPIEQLDPIEVEGTLLVGEKHVAEWSESHSDYGCDSVRMYPAYYRGARAFLIERIWCPGFGYSAEGVEEEVISLEEGIKMCIEHGKWDVFKALEGGS